MLLAGTPIAEIIAGKAPRIREKLFRREKDKVKGEKYYRSERSYGSFVRTLQLPADVQADKVKASFKNGVLEARRPKTEATKANEIKVKVD